MTPWCLLGASLVPPRCLLAPIDLVPGSILDLSPQLEPPNVRFGSHSLELEPSQGELAPTLDQLEPT